MDLKNTTTLLGRYAKALLKYNLLTPWYDREKTKGLIDAVLRYEFKLGPGRKLPTVSIYDVFPELPQQSWTSFGVRCSAETPYLCAALKIIHAKNVLEIGTYHGGATLHLAANLPPDGKVYTVDIDLQQLNRLDFKLDGHDAPLAQKAREQIGHLYRNTPCENRIVQIIQDSATVDFSQYVEHFDLIYIDGGHSYTQVKRDTENALRYIRPGGVVFWHDYHVGCTGVVRYLHELARQYPIQHINQTMLAAWRL